MQRLILGAQTQQPRVACVFEADQCPRLIQDGYVLAVDSSQTELNALNGKIVIAWHKDKGLTVYDHTLVLRSENPSCEAVTLSAKQRWKIVAKVLWWIGSQP